MRDLFFFDFLSYIIWRTPEFQIYLFIYFLDNSSLDTRCEETPVCHNFLFKCDWWDVINSGRGIKKDEYGFTCLNFERTICTDEPFVLASQAKQVFYVQNSNEENWHTVVEIQTRGVYDMNQKVSINDPEPYQQLITLHSQRDVHELVENDLINWDRNDIAGETIQTDVLLSRQKNIVERDNEFIHDDDIDDV